MLDKGFRSLGVLHIYENRYMVFVPRLSQFSFRILKIVIGVRQAYYIKIGKFKESDRNCGKARKLVRSPTRNVPYKC